MEMRLKTNISTISKVKDFCRDLGAHNYAPGSQHGRYLEKDGATIEVVPNWGLPLRSLVVQVKTLTVRHWTPDHVFTEVILVL